MDGVDELELYDDEEDDGDLPPPVPLAPPVRPRQPASPPAAVKSQKEKN